MYAMEAMSPTLVNRGSSKDVYVLNGAMWFEFSKRVSTNDHGDVGVLFEDLDWIRNMISAKIFRKLNDSGFYTHYLDSIKGDNIMHILPLNIPEKNFYLPTAVGRLMLVEIIFRFVITPKFYGRIMSGEVDKGRVEALLGGGEIKIGAVLRSPYIECTTKIQDADVYISDTEAARLAGVTLPELLSIYEKDVTKLATWLRQFFKSAGFDLADGKFEAGIDRKGKFILADSVSPDELRLIGEDGLSHDKDPLRKHYEQTYPEWFQELKAAKEQFPNDKTKWPKYPGPPAPEVVTELIRRYEVVAKAIGAI